MSTAPAQTPGGYEVVASTTPYRGKIISVNRDIVRMPDGSSTQRDVVVHPGAVGVVTLDDDGRIMMIRQYRHPVREPLWELPAGLLDIAGEPASVAAARELAEEAGLTARRWDVLVDVYSSPGMTNEAYRVFLARGVGEVSADFGYVRTDEEADMTLEWVPLEDAVARIFTGQIVNGLATVGILAAANARATHFAGLRPVSAPWPARPAHAG
ncbi:MAG: NUDIX domain-containing protein [Frankia sp.]